MGRWLAEFFMKDEHEVIISDLDEAGLLEAGRQLGVAVTADNTEAVKGADYVLLSVPIEAFEGVVKQIGSHIQSGQVVIDITSIKV